MFTRFCLTAITLFGSLLGDATKQTAELNKAVFDQLPFSNKQDFEDVSNGFIAPLPNGGVVRDDTGRIIWNVSSYDFVNNDKQASVTVNPSLWRQAQLMSKAGLFKVTDGIYQIRSADISNMTIIEGKTGIIVIDPLFSKETAKAAIDLYFQNRPKKDIKAVIYTHSHNDHFGGAKGVISQADVDSGKIKVIAPAGFTKEALDENIMAGNVMGRRALYSYGILLKPGPEGQASLGLGLAISTGTRTLILPTDFVTQTGQEMTIDGIKFIFQMAPNSEAPSEMIFFLPDFKALEISEEATHTMHNLYTLRGAKVRDSKAWAGYINEAIETFGPQTEIIFAQHHWPIWGNARIIDFLEKQRDMYKFIHDQTLRFANQGYSMLQIGDMIKLPDSLSKEWYNRGYYGSLNHNAKAVYNFYLGNFDGNPSTLHQLPEDQASKKYVEYMGGADKVIEKVREDYAKGEYRWAAQALNHVVYADPSNKAARNFLADVLDQLAYQNENGTWRNFYLTGAKELREGIHPLPIRIDSPDIIMAMPVENFLDFLAVKLDGLKAAQHPMLINFNIPDQNLKYVLEIKNGVLHYSAGKNSDKADVTVAMSRANFNDFVLKNESFEDMIKSKKMTVTGNLKTLETFRSLFDQFSLWFNIIEPNKIK